MADKFEKRIGDLVFERYMQFQPKPRGIQPKFVTRMYVSKMLKACTNPIPYRKQLWAYYQEGIKPLRIDDTSRITEPSEMCEQVAILVYLHLLGSHSIPAGLDWKTFIDKLEIEFSDETKADLLERWKATWGAKNK